MKNISRTLIASFACVALTLGAAGALLASGTERGEALTLTGRLAEDGYGGYVLVEAESGEEIAVRGSDEQLAEHVGMSVRLTGEWADDDDGSEYFAVASVEAVTSG